MAHDRRPDRSRKWAQRKKENGLRECLNGGKIYNLAIFLLYVVFTFLSYVVHFIPTHIPAGARLHNNGWHIAAEEIAQCASVSESTLWTSVCVEGLPFANVLVLYVDEDDDGCLYVQWRKAEKKSNKILTARRFWSNKNKKKMRVLLIISTMEIKIGSTVWECTVFLKKWILAGPPRNKYVARRPFSVSEQVRSQRNCLARS